MVVASISISPARTSAYLYMKADEKTGNASDIVKPVVGRSYAPGYRGDFFEI